MDKKIWYLKNADLFSWMNPEEIEELAQTTQMVPCRKNESFFFSEEPSESVYLVKKGRIKLFRTTAAGREIILDILGPGEIFGELALAGEKSRSHSAEAQEDGLVCILPRRIFEEIARRHPDFAFRIIKLIGLRFRAMESRIEDLAFQNVHDRLLLTLGNLAKKHGVPEKNGSIRLPVTQSNLAFLIGATREAVADQLKELKHEGLVKTSYRAIHLMKPKTMIPRETR
jgi:CRP/FNR family transcriptional regulator